jgi:hypothetical protein
MTSIKQIALGAFITLSVFCAVLYASCTKDACKGVTCLNKGNCSGGICTCTVRGIGGSNCQTVYRLLYANKYKGIATYDITHADTNNFLIFTANQDTMFTQMKLEWTDTGTTVITMPIVLTNNAATGSDFIITPTTAGNYTYSGTGNVNGTVANVNLTLMLSSGVGQPIFVTLANFNKQ